MDALSARRIYRDPQAGRSLAACRLTIGMQEQGKVVTWTPSDPQI